MCRNRRSEGESRRQEEITLKFPGALTIIGVGRHGVGPGPNQTNVIKEMNAWASRSTTTWRR